MSICSTRITPVGSRTPLPSIKVGRSFLKDSNSAARRSPTVPKQLKTARRLVATGGTATCLAAIHKVLPDFDPRKVDHSTFTLEQIRALLGSFTGKSLHALKQIPGLPPKRADLIIPGTAVLLATMELLGAKRVGVSVRGLRYGVLTALMRDD